MTTTNQTAASLASQLSSLQATAGAAAPAATAAATTAPAVAPASCMPSGAAAAGAATIAGGRTGSLDAVLQQLATTLQGVIAALGANPASAAPPAGPAGPASMVARDNSFAAVARQGLPINVPPNVSGTQFLGVLSSIADARRTRVANLETAHRQDLTNGTASQVNAIQLNMEQGLNSQTDAIIAKLGPLASTIDSSEAAEVLQMFQEMNRTGYFSPDRMASAFMRITGSAANVPTEVIDKAVRLAGRMTGQQPSPELERFNAALKLAFDAAMADPSGAGARFDRALQAPNLAAATAALA